MDNPRLIPEDSPHPVVVAPEAPVYETLESFRSGETTLRYRYRLTATSRATGLSSHEEVEVYVSSSRPGVYCPLEIVVEEGGTVALDCEGVDPLSFRMDYDEEAASVLWEWEGLWGTSTAPLAATDLSSPLFTAPPGSAGAEYHYIASMTTSASGAPRMARRRVTVRVTDAEEGIPQEIADVNASASMSGLSCPEPYVVFVGDPPLTIGCSGRESEVQSVEWINRDPLSNHTAALTSTSVRYPVFHVSASLPREVEAVRWDYYVIFRLHEGGEVRKSVRVTELNRANLRCSWPNVQEGDDDIQFDCEVTDGPSGVEEYTYAWEARSDTPNTDLLVDGTDTPTPTFSVPDDIDEDKNYRYSLIASAAGFHPAKAIMLVRVRDRADIAVACGGPYEVAEGGEDIELKCEASGSPGGNYTWKWTGANTSFLSDDEVADPTFTSPDDITGHQVYTYTVTASADDAAAGSAEVTVRVKDTDIPDPVITCNDPDPVYEGTADFTLDCSVEHEPSDPMYAWTTRGSTLDTSLLTSGRDGLTPTFSVPNDIDEPGGADKNYEYTVALASPSMFNLVTADVTVAVLERPDITVACEDSPYEVDEGDDPIKLECGTSGAPGTEPDYTWSWLPTTNLTNHNENPSTFTVPDNVDQDTTYTYTVTASAANAEDGTAEVTVTVKDTGTLAPVITCVDSEVYEGTADFTLNCMVENEPSGATYSWAARGDTQDTSLLTSGTSSLTPTFAVPDDIPGPFDSHEYDDYKETFEYTVTLSASGILDVTGNVKVTVRERHNIRFCYVDLSNNCYSAYGHYASNHYTVWEGAADFNPPALYTIGRLKNAPGSNPVYTLTLSGSPATALSLMAPLNIQTMTGTDTFNFPTFFVPDQVDRNTNYVYTLTISAPFAEDAVYKIFILVKDRSPSITCIDSEAYEGAADFTLNCTVENEPSGATYSWAARGDTQDTSLLTSGTSSLTPTFAVPDDVQGTTDYEYRVTLSASGIDDVTEDITVTVLDKPDIYCSDPGFELIAAKSWETYEGNRDFPLRICEQGWAGAPGANPVYAFAWAARGTTANTDLLSATNIEAPTFATPDTVESTENYEYRLTVSAANANSYSMNVGVAVFNALNLVCEGPYEVDEGDADIKLECDASGVPDKSLYTWSWLPSTNLTEHYTGTPIFDVPDDVDKDTTWKYGVTVGAFVRGPIMPLLR